jgi:hypothetical protein
MPHAKSVKFCLLATHSEVAIKVISLIWLKVFRPFGSLILLLTIWRLEMLLTWLLTILWHLTSKSRRILRNVYLRSTAPSLHLILLKLILSTKWSQVTKSLLVSSITIEVIA